MIDINNTNNGDLDRMAEDVDARRGEVMMGHLYTFLGRFVAYPSAHARVAHALWILHAHLMDRWESTPRLAFLSPEPASGKSRALEVTEDLVPRAVCTVNVSPAYLFRKVADEDGPPTVLFDEIDTVFGPKAKDNEEIRGWLNAGHRRGAMAGRCVMRGKIVETEELPAYCAVAVAGLGWLPDTILTRSVIIRMRRRHAGETVEPFRHRIHSRQAVAVRMAIEVWAGGQPSEIEWPEMPAAVQDRDADVWEALLAVADLVGGEWPKLAREAAVALVADSKDGEPSLGIRLLADVRSIFIDGLPDVEALASKTLLQRLLEIPEAPWNDLKGKPLDERRLSRFLKPYGVKSKTVRIVDSTPKGYAKVDLHDAWARYLPQPSPAKSETSATEATSLIFQRQTVADCGVTEGNVADTVSLVADVVADHAPKTINKFNVVSGVALVADVAGDSCAQCGGDGAMIIHDGARFHPECRQYLVKMNGTQSVPFSRRPAS
jgi:hypothetical protein